MAGAQAARRWLVSGRVQGVWYRASCREQALRLGLHGLARNLADGRVEVIAAGSTAALDQLEDWLWLGPPLARVEQVLAEPHDPERVSSGFGTG